MGILAECLANDEEKQGINPLFLKLIIE